MKSRYFCCDHFLSFPVIRWVCMKMLSFSFSIKLVLVACMLLSLYAHAVKRDLDWSCQCHFMIVKLVF